MSYTHLSIIERSQLDMLNRQGWSVRAIAQEIGRHHSTVAREIKRNHVEGVYEAKVSQRAYQKRRESFTPLGKWTTELAKQVEERLRQTWSPEQISQSYKTAGNPMVSFKTIYRWIYDGRLARAKISMLRHKGKRRKPIETRGRFLVGKSIKQRPKEVRSRETFGHWELDTVVSSRG